MLLGVSYRWPANIIDYDIEMFAQEKATHRQRKHCSHSRLINCVPVIHITRLPVLYNLLLPNSRMMNSWEISKHGHVYNLSMMLISEIIPSKRYR